MVYPFEKWILKRKKKKGLTNLSGKRKRCRSMINVKTVKAVIPRLMEAHKSIQNRANSFLETSNIPSRLHWKTHKPRRSVGSKLTRSCGQDVIVLENIRPSRLATGSRWSVSNCLKITKLFMLFHGYSNMNFVSDQNSQDDTNYLNMEVNSISLE